MLSVLRSGLLIGQSLPVKVAVQDSLLARLLTAREQIN